MKTSHVKTAILSALRGGADSQLASVAKRPFNGANINIVEKQFFKTVGESGASGLHQLLSCNDENRKTVVFDGQRHYRKYFAMGRYLTLLGEISLKRGIYQSNIAARSICPLELKLKFINDYVSFAAAEYICCNMSLMTLGEFVNHCKKWTFMKPSEGTVKRVLEYVGRFLETTDFFDIIRSEETGPTEAVTLAISLDSTSVHIRQKGWKHATAATVSVYDTDGKRLDTIYVGRMPEAGKRKIKRLLEKEAQAKKAKQNFQHIVCIADGARDLWLYFQKKYPGTIHVADFFHVCEHLSKLSGLIFSDHTKARVWYKKYRKILKSDPKGADKAIRAARYRRDSIKENKEVNAEVKYLQHNRKRMNYFELRQKKLPIGSGVVEAACKNLIGARMKKSGMRWSIDGGQTILTLRSIILSGRWEDFWSCFIRHHFSKAQT